MPGPPLCLGVLISGSGTNLQAIIDAIEVGQLPARIALVLSNRPGVAGLERAERHGLRTQVVSHKDFPSREAYDARLVEILRAAGVDLVVLAGFDRLISPRFIGAFPQRIMNIHPALLPAFPGLHAQRQAVAWGVRFSGATVHFVDEQTDHGPIITQAVVPVLPGDTEETLRERILEQEHRLYPWAIRLYAEGRLEVRGRTVHVRDARWEHAALLSPTRDG